MNQKPAPHTICPGMMEVRHKVSKFKKMDHHELHEYLENHAVPIVIDSDSEAHLIDHHHLVRACWELGIEQVFVEVVADFSDYSHHTFWEKMKKSNWVRLFDQFGKGPHEPVLLPLGISGLADDPYRSLAWALREEGIIEKSPEPFSEFKWADLLRVHVEIERNDEGFDKAKIKALKIVSEHKK